MEVLALAIQACASIYIGCELPTWKKQFRNMNSKKEDETATPEEEESVDLTYAQVLSFPITASIMLVSLYFFHNALQYFLLAVVLLSTSIAVFDLSSFAWQVSTLVSSKSISTAAGLTTLFLLFAWLKTGSYILLDILGNSLCILFISTVRFPSLRMAALCLVLLLFYDVYWVFFSEQHFQANVMVQVATKSASNPVHETGKSLGISFLQSFPETLDLPMKLIVAFPWSRPRLLGLGDITLPGLLVSLAFATDRASREEEESSQSLIKKTSDIENNTSNNETSINEDTANTAIATTGSPISEASRSDNALIKRISVRNASGNFGVYSFAFIGYLFGLALAFFVNLVSQYPQPALLYIVPVMLLFITWRAHQLGLLQTMWNGPKYAKEMQ